MIHQKKIGILFRFLLILILFNNGCLFAKAHISFMVADLKYNSEQGIKICELQAGSISKFDGLNYINKSKDHLANQLCQILSQYHDRGWFHQSSIVDPQIVKNFKTLSWKMVSNIDKLDKNSELMQIADQIPKNPDEIHSYGGILYIGMYHLHDKIISKFPNLIIMDDLLIPYKDKRAMSLLIDTDPQLSRYRPKTKVCERKYTSQLANEIISEIGGNIFVIKPTNLSRGHGVIIVNKDELNDTLKLILKNKKKLKKEKDPSYRYWGYDFIGNYFLVEEFISSDEVIAHHLHHRPYDGTIRAPFLLIYNEGEIKTLFFDLYWKLPKKSLVDHASLNEKHKSFAVEPYFLAVKTSIKHEIERQLSEAMKILHKKLLN